MEGASEALKVAVGSEPLGNVAEASSATGSAGEENAVKSLSEGIEKIVGVVLKGKDKADVGDEKNPGDDNGAAGNSRNAGDGNANNGALALFAKKAIADSQPGVGKAAKDASKAVGAVNGIAISEAISKGESGDAAKLAIYLISRSYLNK